MMRMHNTAASGRKVRKVERNLNRTICVRPNDVVGQVFVTRLAVSLIRLHRGVTFASIC
jgi:hypothetical protein